MPGKVNPADLATRGATAVQLSEQQQWWKGPSFLAGPEEDWPQCQITVPSELPGQLKRACHLNVPPPTSRLHPDNYSSWTHLKRITGWCRRFICRASKGKYCSTPTADSVVVTPDSPQLRPRQKTSSKVSSEPLTADELQAAENHWICQAQREAFPDTYSELVTNKPSRSGRFSKLRVYLDENSRTIKVGGRLRTSHHLPSSVRNPVILPPQHRVTQLIIQEEDSRCNHAVGPNHILSNLSLHYWIIKGKATVRRHRRECVTRRKKWQKAATPVMAPLPDMRTADPLLAFSRVGIDFAGPFYTKQGRGKSQLKRYVCVFSCLLTRACHLEMVYSLATDGFLQAFTRFCKRRGTPKVVLSDNGSNFVAAEREIREALEALDRDQILRKSAEMNIKWHFNPPRSSHFGGEFETLVKAMKRVLSSVLSRANLTDEELLTALVEAEALLNSRPLTALIDDPDDPQPLTPLHFLVGHQNASFALEEATDSKKVTPATRWHLDQTLLKQVWQRWLREVLPKLHVSVKWNKNQKNVAVGDVLLVMDDQTARANWPLGRVTAVHPGKDGVVRVVDIKIREKVYRRSVHNLIPLEVESASSEQQARDTAEVWYGDLDG